LFFFAIVAANLNKQAEIRETGEKPLRFVQRSSTPDKRRQLGKLQANLYRVSKGEDVKA